jgi:isoleucyl-tRNA synthetase
VLTTVARLLAPFTPFVAEVLHQHLVQGIDPEAADSVHLERWPEPGEERRDQALEDGMAAVQRIVRLGHAARNTHGLKTRQPLAAVTLVAADPRLPELVAPHAELLADELNVHRIRWAADRSEYVHHEVRPVYPKTGPRFGKQMREVAAALAAADGDQLAARLEAEGRVEVELSTGPAELSAEEVEVRLIERPGTATQGDRELLVALDTELTPELVAEGLAREVVHRIQTRRKEADLDYADRIRVRYRAAPELEAAIGAHRGWIAGETLAVELAAADGADEIDELAGLEAAPVESHDFALAVERVEPDVPPEPPQPDQR